MLADRGIRDSDLLCGMLLSIRYRVRRADNTFAGGPMYILDSASEKKKTGSGVCGVYAVCVVWHRQQRAVILHTHGAPASDYRVCRIWSEWRSGCLQGLLSSGETARLQRCVCGSFPLMSAFYVGGCLYIIGRNRAVLPETLALILSSARLPEGGGGRLHRRSAASWHPDRSLPGIVHQ